ncbi:MAG TPA: RlmE family RNA methyltransferase [Thermoplasmata archaeon]|nr:RlmE family RNA methyltransferase [Thermoplasmata archaeon]
MGKAWVKARRRDPYYRAAKEQGLRSRAVWKLVQIQQRFGLIHEGDTIVDFGAAPGGWSRAAAEMVGPRGRVIAVDRVAMAPIERVTLIRGDFTDPGVVAKILEDLRTPADVVLCDAAPKLSGNRSLDMARALDLAAAALRFATKALRTGGAFVAKAFQGEGYRTFLREVSDRFAVAKGYVPPATTKGSSEIYVVALEKLV